MQPCTHCVRAALLAAARGEHSGREGEREKKKKKRGTACVQTGRPLSAPMVLTRGAGRRSVADRERERE